MLDQNDIQTIKEIVVDGRVMTLCHYPMLSYPQVRRGFMVDINDLGAFRRRP